MLSIHPALANRNQYICIVKEDDEKFANWKHV